MVAILKLALRSAWARRLTLGIAVIAIALAAALLLGVERIRQEARHGFVQTISGVDLVVGARTGAVQLVLYAVFHSGAATNNMSWESYHDIASHPAVAWAVPLSLGDSHLGHPVVGTSAEYFTRFRYADQQALHFAAGQVFGDVFEAVLGHAVAQKQGYRLGDHITLNHGMAELGPDHADKPFVVKGILAPTGTAVDNAAHVSLEAITAIHLDWAGGAPLPGLSIPAGQVKKFPLQPREITAVLIGLKSRSDVFRLQRFINEYRGEPLLAVLPGVALDDLWQTVNMVETILLVLSAMVALVGLAGLSATLLAGLNERRRELAILRALGASPQAIFAMLIIEGLLVTLVGIIAGTALLASLIATLGTWLQMHFGIHVSLQPPTYNEWLLLAAILFTGLVASLVPGWRAWRMSLMDGLIPRR